MECTDEGSVCSCWSRGAAKIRRLRNLALRNTGWVQDYQTMLLTNVIDSCSVCTNQTSHSSASVQPPVTLMILGMLAPVLRKLYKTLTTKSDRPALAMHARRWLYHTLQHQWHAVLPFQICVTPVAITAVYNTLTAAGHHCCALTGSSNTERLLHENQHLSSTKCAPSSVPVFVTLRQRPTFAPCQ